MRRNGVKMFLMALLYLFVYETSFAQSCISVVYDNNGNRKQLEIAECSVKKIVKKDIIRTGVSEYEDKERVAVYPNPNEGVINVEINDDNVGLSSRYEVYDMRGLLLCRGEFIDVVKIDIGNQPTGTYLLKVIGEDNACVKMIVKL